MYYIDIQYVNLASWNHLASQEPSELTGDDVDKDPISIILRKSNASANVTSYIFDSSKCNLLSGLSGGWEEGSV